MLCLEIAALAGTHLTAIIGPLFYPLSFVSSRPYLAYTGYATIAEIPRIGLYLFVMFASGDPLSRFGLRKINLTRDLQWFVVASVAVAFLYWGCYTVYPDRWAVLTKPWDSYLTLAPVWLLASHMLLVGIAEELFYRGYLITRLEELSGSTWLAVLVQALFFGSVHSYEGFTGMVVTALFGTIMGIAFTQARSIWPLVLAHGGLDFVLEYIRLQHAVPGMH